MTCTEFQECIADYLAESLGAGAAESFERHSGECSACRQELSQVEQTWSALGMLPDESPSAGLRGRFYETLAAYRHGLEHSPERRHSIRERINDWLSSWWPRQPIAQAGLAAVLVAAGLGGGLMLRQDQRPQNPQVAQLTEEVQSMRQLMALSLLQQQSASERLKGVNYSYRLERTDDKVLSALLQVLSSDSSVDVRLAAVDALYKYAEHPRVREGLTRALPAQTSPLVQLALIELIGEMRDRDAAEPLRALVRSSDANPNVRERAQKVLGELQ